MPSSDEYKEKCLKRINGVGYVATRPVMGDYIVYVEDRPVAGIYEDRFFLVICEASEAGLGDAQSVSPYVGAGEMFLVPEDLESEKLKEIIGKMVLEIPVPKACRRFAR